MTLTPSPTLRFDGMTMKCSGFYVYSMLSVVGNEPLRGNDVPKKDSEHD